MNPVFRAICFLVCLVYARCGYTQNMRLAQLSVNDGLSQSMVTCMLHDSRGLMWIGTGAGLNKYDGNSVVVYKHHQNDTGSINNNVIRKILEDKLGNLWIGTEGGLCMLERQSNRIIRVTPSVIGEVRPLFFEKDSLLYFFWGGKGFSHCNIFTRELHVYPNSQYSTTLNLGIFDAIKSAHDGQYRFTSNLGIFILDISGTEPVCRRDSTLNAILPDPYANSLVTGKQEIWVATLKGAVRYHLRNKTYKHYPGIEHVALDHNAQLWGYSYSGLFRFDPASQQFIRASFDNRTNFPVNVKKIYSDRNKNLWIGTDGMGAFVYNPSSNKFPLYNKASLFSNGSLSSDFIKCFSSDRYNRLWTGTYKEGINVIDFSNRSLKHFLKDAIVHSMYCDSNDMWIGTDDGLYRCNIHTFKVVKQAYLKSSARVFYITKLKNGMMILATSEGMYGSLRNDHSSFKLLHAETVTHVYEDKHHTLWIAGWQKIWASQYPFTTFKEIVLSKEKQFPKDFRPKSFQEDTLGRMWISGNTGLIRYEQHAQQYFGEAEGLPDQMIYGIVRDDRGYLWMSSNKGICRFNPYNGTCINYDAGDGLQSNEFNSGAYYKDLHGKICFGGVNGFNIFDPATIIQSRNNARINLVGLKVADKDYRTATDYTELKTLSMAHTDNTLSFEFAAMDHGHSGKRNYAYYLEGIDKNWVESGSRGFARYTDIAPGTYLLKAKVTYDNGLWGDEQHLLRIVIMPPWWSKWWFVAAMIILVLVIFYVSIRYFVRRKLREQAREMEKLHAVNLERTRISKDMHDDLGSGLSRIAIMSQLLKQQLQQEKNEQVEKISSTASDLIDSMSHIIWAMNPDNDRIENLVAYLRMHAAELLESCGLNCVMNFPAHTPEIALTQESRRNIFLVIKESLNNILKHASASAVCIDAVIYTNKLVITIKDDGKGFDPAHANQGNGLGNMKKRMEQIGGTYRISSSPGAGTTTVVSFPIL